MKFPTPEWSLKTSRYRSHLFVKSNSVLGFLLFSPRKVMLVYFIGGVTYMEIAALRFLNKQRECASRTLEACSSKVARMY